MQYTIKKHYFRKTHMAYVGRYTVMAARRTLTFQMSRQVGMMSVYVLKYV